MARRFTFLRSLVTFSQKLVVRVLAVGSVLALGQYVLNADSRKQRVSLREKVDEVKALNAQLATQNVQLRMQVQAIQHDDRYLEQVARQELGMVRPTEVVYTFLN